jgi:hypothetical protein
MPVRDWTRVPAGIFHDFHTAWLGSLRQALNGGVLPAGYYALIDQDAGEIGQPLEQQGRRRDRRVVIRHVSDDRLIALIEVVSPANKGSQNELRAFVRKVIAALNQGLHVLVIDLFPPTPRDPHGLHSAVVGSLGLPPFEAPPGQPLTLVSYAAGAPPTAYLEPVGVGNELPDMPLFLLPEWYVNVPLERTYQETWEATPEPWRRVLEDAGGP